MDHLAIDLAAALGNLRTALKDNGIDDTDGILTMISPHFLTILIVTGGMGLPVP